MLCCESTHAGATRTSSTVAGSASYALPLELPRDLGPLEPYVLPTGLLAAFEEFFSADMSALRIRLLPRESDLGCSAFALADTVYLKRSVLSLAPADFERLLVHEFAHCLQQRAGRVSGTPFTFVYDEELEREADELASLWRAALTPRSVSRRTAILSRMQPADQPSPPVAQPVVHIVVEPTNYSPTVLGTYSKKSEVNSLWDSLLNVEASKRVIQALSAGQQRSAKTKLRHWVTAPKHRSFFSAEKKGHAKQFRNREELARALAGRVTSGGSKATEAQLARRVGGSDWVKRNLKLVIRNVHDYKNAMAQYRAGRGSVNSQNTMARAAINYQDSMIDRGQNPGWTLADTQQYVLDKENDEGGFLEGLVSEVVNNEFGGSGRYAYFYSPGVAAIKKSKERTYAEGLRYLLRNDEPSYKMAAFLCDFAMVFRDLISESTIPFNVANEDSRATHFSVDESTAWVKRARAHNIRLGAGPSATTMQVLRVVKYVSIWKRDGIVNPDSNFTSADKDVMKAVALALFEFWNSHANQKRAEIHTYHEVMIVAHGYGCEIEHAIGHGATRALAEFEYPALTDIPG